MKEIGEIKSNIYKIAAVTDRGQRLNKLILNNLNLEQYTTFSKCIK